VLGIDRHILLQVLTKQIFTLFILVFLIVLICTATSPHFRLLIISHINLISEI
jgi:hypothetical protein